MADCKVPVIKNLTLAQIGDYLCTQFGYKKGDLGSFIYQDSATFRKKANGSRPVQADDIVHLENTITEKLCENATDKYFELMKHWFPELGYYKSESDLRAIISANLMGIAYKQNGHNEEEFLENIVSPVLFFQLCLNNSSPIHCIKMSFQTGWAWFDDIEKRELLKSVLNKNIPVQVIGNPMSSMTRRFVYSMRDPEKELDYKGVNETLLEWHKYEVAFETLNLFVSADFPILREVYLVEFEDGSNLGLIRNYAYGSPVEKIAQYKLIPNNNPEFEYYHTEFSFLMEKCLTYDEWKKTLPKRKEIFPIGDYILLYPSHVKKDTEEQPWIYCLLSIHNNNKASLRVNIPNIDMLSDMDDSYEYLYEGDIKVTGKIIYITMYDESTEELITLSIPRPGRHFNRYIGIMGALNPSGYAPISFKCACFSRSVLSKIDFTLLRSLLNNNNQMYHDSLMILEPQDTDLFYSNRIFNES